MITEHDFFGHWFYFLIATGMFFISKKEHFGWALRLMGEIGWMWLGWLMGMSSIFLWGWLFILIDLNGFLTWREEEKKQEPLESIPAIVGKTFVATINGNVPIEEYNENKQLQSERAELAKSRSRSCKSKVQPARGRRSIKADGKRRSRSNVKSRSSKKAGRNVRVQKDNRRTNANRTKASKG